MMDRQKSIAWPHVFLIALVLSSTIGFMAWIDHRQPALTHAVFPEVPRDFEGWKGQDALLDKDILALLKPDKLVFRRYVNPRGEHADLYAVFYLSQTTQKTFHSPLNCYPGGGWQILENRSVMLHGAQRSAPNLNAKRLVIQKGLVKRLVYFWYYAGGQIASNQYLNKWLTVKNTLLQGRSDGGLITISTELGLADSVPEAFEKEFVPRIIDYLHHAAAPPTPQ